MKIKATDELQRYGRAINGLDQDIIKVHDRIDRLSEWTDEVADLSSNTFELTLSQGKRLNMESWGSFIVTILMLILIAIISFATFKTMDRVNELDLDLYEAQERIIELEREIDSQDRTINSLIEDVIELRGQ